MKVERINKVALSVLLVCSLFHLPPTSSAQHARSPQRIYFPRHRVSTSVKGTLRRGATREYMLRAAEGETMNVKVCSADKTVLFDVGLRRASLIRDEGFTDSWSGTLPETGDYKIIVVTESHKPQTYTLDVSVT